MAKKAMLLACVVAPLLLATPASGAGTSASNFLKIAPGARSAGMGEAFTAIADDASAMYWNVAGLSSLNSKELQVSYNSWFQGIQHSFVAFAMPIGSGLPDVSPADTLGFSVTSLGMNGLERRASNTVSADGSFSVGDLAIAAGYSRRIYPSFCSSFSAGGSLKFIRQAIDEYTATAVAADLGVLYPFTVSDLPFTAGLSLKNLGTPVKFLDESYPLPLTCAAGLSFVPPDRLRLPVAIAGDVSFSNDNDIVWRLGAEYFAGDILTLRLGYADRGAAAREALAGGPLGALNDTTVSRLTGFTAGFGVAIPLKHILNTASTLDLDYAFVPYGDLGNTQRISLGLKW